MLLHPSFPESEMGDVRDQMLAAVASRYDNPGELAEAHFDNQLFGEKHPNGWVLTADDVRKIDRAKLEKFWKTFYHPNHAILAVAGDVDATRLRAQLEKAFHGWARANAPARPGWTIPPATGTRILLVDRPDLTQATIVLGHAGIKHADPRWYAVTLMNYVLGGSDFSSRLMTEVRSKRGLTYGIGSSFGASLYQGAFRVSAATKNETVWDALLASVNEIRRMQTEGPTHGELDKAKGYYAGSYPFSLQAAAGIAGALVGAEEHGLGIGYVRDLAAAAGGGRRGAGQGGGQGFPAPRRALGGHRRQGGRHRAAAGEERHSVRADQLQGPDQRGRAGRRQADDKPDVARTAKPAPAKWSLRREPTDDSAKARPRTASSVAAEDVGDEVLLGGQRGERQHRRHQQRHPAEPRAIAQQQQRQHGRVRHVQRREDVARRIDVLDPGHEGVREVGVGGIKDGARVLGADEEVPHRAQRHHQDHRHRRAIEEAQQYVFFFCVLRSVLRIASRK